VEGTATCCVNEYDVVRPDGSGLRTVFSAAEPIHDTPVVRWAPDGTRLAFATDARAAGDPALAILDIPSGTVHRLRRYPAGGSVPSWSPDGRRIAFAALVPLRGGFFMCRVVIAAPDGTPQGTLAAPGAPVDVTWSPDGARLLVTVAPSPDAQAREVHIVHPTGGTASAVIRLPHGSGVLDAEWASRG
jgi:Tol biopolymer transport system component